MRANLTRASALIMVIGLAGIVTISGHAEIAKPGPPPLLVNDKQSSNLLFFQTQTPFQHLATYRLLGASIRDKSGKVIGDIEDLIVSTDNRIIGVIMGVGGALGFGEKKIAVRMSALRITREDKKTIITLNASPDDIDKAPVYKEKHPKKSLIERGAEATKQAIKKAARKTTETVAKAKEATRKAVEPAKPLPAAKPTK